MIPYRLRGFLKGFFKLILVLVLLAVVFGGIWLLWLNRYVVYTRDGVILDFGISLEFPLGELPSPPEPGPEVDIVIHEPVDETVDNTQMKQISGLYITADQLINAMDQVEEAVKQLPLSTPIMLDVKNIRGEFYYASDLGKLSGKVDPERVTSLINMIHARGNYLIARMPALRDYWYGLEHVNSGVFNPNQLSLWMDEERCYWLHPAAEGTVSYIMQIIKELRTLGFNEVVLYDFCVPDTQNIYFPEDRAEVINTFAENLVKSCTGSNFAVSFVNSSSFFVLPNGRTRIVYQNVSAADAASLANRTDLTDPTIQLLFVTDLKDTRFDDFSVLRPLEITE